VVLVQEYAEGGDLYRLLHRNGGRCGARATRAAATSVRAACAMHSGR
jgi:hypothetical protein